MTLLFITILLLAIYSLINTLGFALYRQQQTVKYKKLNIKVDTINEQLEILQKTCVKLMDYFRENNKSQNIINNSNRELTRVFVEERNKLASDINILMKSQKETHDFLTSLKECKDIYKKQN